jgi:hypothetical protein
MASAPSSAMANETAKTAAASGLIFSLSTVRITSMTVNQLWRGIRPSKIAAATTVASVVLAQARDIRSG